MQLIRKILTFLSSLFKKSPPQKEGEIPPPREIILYPRTKELRGKRNRKLHPKLRELLEAQIFKDGIPPESFINRNAPLMIHDTAHAFLSLEVRETGNNMGYKVGLIQSVIGEETTTGNGDPWCMSFVQCVVAFVEDYLEIESRLLDSEHCMSTLRHARDNYITTLIPKIGCIVVWEHGNTDSGHTGIVVEIRGRLEMATIEGNTGDKSFRDGDGIYLRNRSIISDGSMTVRGFIAPFSNL